LLIILIKKSNMQIHRIGESTQFSVLHNGEMKVLEAPDLFNLDDYDEGGDHDKETKHWLMVILKIMLAITSFADLPAEHQTPETLLSLFMAVYLTL